MSLGIFTACFGYERWLPEWEAAVRAMDPPPDEVLIVGDDAAAQVWGGTGTFTGAPDLGNPYRQAASYNLAVARMHSEWICKVDVDDLVLPGLRADLEPYFARADVVAFDTQRERDGIPAGIRRNRPTAMRMLEPNMGGQVLDSSAAFRRSLWMRAPFNEVIPGGADVALWIGFARLGARFASTGRPGVRYRLHADSMWHRRDAANIRRVRQALNRLRRPGPHTAGEPALSLSIMAHPRREHFVTELLGRLDAPAVVVWDERQDRWDTGRRALLSYGTGATHHLVIQDDAVVPRNLVAGVAKMIRQVARAPISLYTGRHGPNGSLFERLGRRAEREAASWIVSAKLWWGVGLVFPVELIAPMVTWCDENRLTKNYDLRLSRYLEAEQIPVFYTVPSYVDHRVGPSNPSMVPGRLSTDRRAQHFIGTGADATTWQQGPAVVEPLVSNRACPRCGAPALECAMSPAGGLDG